MPRKNHFYTAKEKEFLKNNIYGKSYKEMTVLFNEHFDLKLPEIQIKAAIKRYDLKNGIDAKFKKGDIPWNKGEHNIRVSPKTEFQKGNIPANTLPIGYERISKDGYIEVKVRNPREWKFKHRLIWEQINGEIPKGHSIIFLDQNKRNFAIDNLMLVSRAELLVLNKNELLYKNKELSESGVVIAKLINEIRQRKKEVRGEFG